MVEHHDIPSDARDMRLQLQEVCGAIDRLKKSKASIPDGLRSEKLRLVNELSSYEQGGKYLARLMRGLNGVVRDLKKKLPVDGQKSSPSATKTAKKKRKKKQKGRKRSKEPKTPGEVLRAEIIKALRKHNGRASSKDVVQEVGRQLEGKLLPHDMDKTQTGVIIWENNTCWERYLMVQDGLLKKGSPRGIWELEE